MSMSNVENGFINYLINMFQAQLSLNLLYLIKYTKIYVCFILNLKLPRTQCYICGIVV